MVRAQGAAFLVFQQIIGSGSSCHLKTIYFLFDSFLSVWGTNHSGC